MAEEISDITTFEESWEGHSGAQVESFIKRAFAQKAGVFYEDVVNNRYLVFATEASRDMYIADTSRTDLILGTIVAGGGGGGETDAFNINIELLSDYYMAVLPSQKGLYIEFNFNVTNKQGLPTGDDILAQFTFRWNSTVKTVTQKFTAGQRARLAIDDYIGESGITNITIQLSGVTTSASTTFAVVCNKVDLSLSDSFKVNNTYNLISNPTASIEIPYTLSGAGLKTMEWYIDGQLQPLSQADDEVTEQTTSRTKYISAAELSEGVHSLQFRAYTLVNGEKFYSQTIYREFAVYRGLDTVKVLIMVGADLNVGELAATSGLTLNNITQYLPYTIKVGVFNPGNTVTPVDVYLDTEKQTTLNMTNAGEQEYTFTVTTSGANTIKLSYLSESRIIPVDVIPSSSSLVENVAGLSLSLKALGKSNAAADKESWTYKDITTDFSDFKWNAQSGWNDNRLVMADGASIVVKQAPLSTDVTSTGKTLEFEFATSSVLNDDAVICDLRTGNAGLLITASEASLTSAAGTKVSVKYKSEENIRIAFVINPKIGTANKQLVFIYVNGILSGAANYAISDNFRVTKELTFVSSGEATIRLKELRFYDNALSSDQILNNYMLYRDTVAEMLEVYDRNDIYEEGSSEFSVDILSGQLPIMVITGNVPALEATTDKNLQIEVDVEYTDLQEPSRSFKMTKAALRPQGTSSMSYPKKNFRLYTNKLANTVLYDSAGNAVQNKLYSFRAGAQPVNCWCFKADYAESSSTHNTGIARLWNDVLVNAQINGEYKLRTNAQKKAIENSYPYDVRTTIDGFPILMFYRLTANSPLVFIGKYNFNNDKSTESVFGFKDIPGFDNSKMQCWEVLNNGHHLALFQDVTNWANEWQDAFEGRYPDGNTNTSDLRKFAAWLASVSQSDFAAQKWEHLDVYKVAAYYIYLMRFGAVDQVVKNAMFTTEDGEHWYYINYDNDTINGLRNDGLLVYPPTIDRQTLDTTFTAEVYCYAGHDSRLWNMLEGDTEFMDIVKEVDAALYTAGLSYDNVIKMFDEEQSDKWCERIYNQDSQYKYIGPFNNNNINNLFMVQGSRQSHRRWWLSRRFNLMDGKFVSGAYKDNVFEVKLAGAPIGLKFSIVSGFPMNYGYGVNNVPIQAGIFLNNGAGHEFSTESVLNVGDPLRLYAAPNIKEIDIHNFTPYLSTVNMAGVFSATLGSVLEKLVLGSDGNATNNALYELSGISNAIMLKHLDIRGYKGINALNLTNNARLTTLLASNSGLASLTLADGAPVTRLDLPSTMQIIDLHNLPLLTLEGLTVAGNFSGVTTLKITGCRSLDSKAIIDAWLANKSTEHSQCSVELDNINWAEIEPNWLVQFGNMLSVSFKGMVAITEINESIAEQLVATFGVNCFNAAAEFYIKLPAGSTVLAGPSQVHEEQSYQYVAILEDIVDDIEFSINPASAKNIQVSQTGVLTVGLDPDPLSIIVNAYSRDANNNLVQVGKAVVIEPYTYPANEDIDIDGKSVLTSTGSYRYDLLVSGGAYSGRYSVEWSMVKESGTEVALETDNDSCTLLLTNLAPGEYIKLKVAIKTPLGKVVASKELSILTVTSPVIMTAERNPNMMSYMYSKGYAAQAEYMTRDEAEALTEIVIDSTLNDPENTSFDEFVYFTNIINYTIPKLRSITLPFITLGKSPTYQIQAVTVNAPYLTEILAPTDNNYDGYINCEVFNAPALRTITGQSNYGSLALILANEFNVPELVEINFAKTSLTTASNARIFSLQPFVYLQTITFPKLRTIKCSKQLMVLSIPTSGMTRKSYAVDYPALLEIENAIPVYFAGSVASYMPIITLKLGANLTLPEDLHFLQGKRNAWHAFLCIA